MLHKAKTPVAPGPAPLGVAISGSQDLGNQLGQQNMALKRRWSLPRSTVNPITHHPERPK